MLLSIYFPGASPDYSKAFDKPVLTFALNAAFLSQSWDLEYFPFLDGPYWSLSYEVIYYIIFAFFIYTKGPLRWLLVSLACLAAGPKILALFPCWLVGVAAYKLREASVGQSIGWVATIFASMILVGAFLLGLKGIANDLSDKVTLLRYTSSEGFLKKLDRRHRIFPSPLGDMSDQALVPGHC